MKNIRTILLVFLISHIVTSITLSYLKSQHLGLPEALVSLGLLSVFAFYSYLVSKDVPDIRNEVADMMKKKDISDKELEARILELLKERDEKITDITNQMGKHDFADKYDKSQFRF